MFYLGVCKGCDVVSHDQLDEHCVSHYYIRGSKCVYDAFTRFLASAVMDGIISLLGLSVGLR